VTLALKRTHSLLEQELEKSAVQAETLEHSSQTLRQLEHSYSAFDVLLTGSRKLIRELESADKWDRWMIYGGLGVFALTCAWIVYKRVLRGPLGLVVWGVGKALGSGRSEMAGAREVEGVQVKGVKVTVEIPELKETGFGEGKEHEILWREGMLPDEVVKEVSDASVEKETPAVEAVV
jgi:Sec20